MDNSPVDNDPTEMDNTPMDVATMDNVPSNASEAPDVENSTNTQDVWETPTKSPNGGDASEKP
jgi:hypothetical protein